MDKLADFFDPTTDEEFTGIYEGIAHPDKSTDARQAVAQVRERLRKFEQALVRLGKDLSDDSPQLKPGASGMTLVCRPTPLVRLHPLGRALLTDPNTGWHLFQ